MKKLSILLVALSLIVFSCNKDDGTPDLDEAVEASFLMNFDGQTYTEADLNSLTLINGSIGVAGTEGDGFSLRISGVGADGTTVNVCTDFESCDPMCTLILDFGAAVGKEGLLATSGTIKRTGNKIEVSVSGISTSLETKSLTATIVVESVLDL